MELQDINTNIEGRDEHVPEVERYIRILKERVHSNHYLSKNCPLTNHPNNI